MMRYFSAFVRKRLPSGPLVMMMLVGGADLKNNKPVRIATALIRKIALSAAARPKPKVSVMIVTSRLEVTLCLMQFEPAAGLCLFQFPRSVANPNLSGPEDPGIDSAQMKLFAHR